MIKTFNIKIEGKSDLPMPEDMPVSLKEIGEKFYEVSGIYFAWRQWSDVYFDLQYVGKSRNIGERVYGKMGRHAYGARRPEIAGCLVNVVLFPEHEIHLAELFYIWKLRPRMNSETKKLLEGLPKVASATVYDVEKYDPNFTGLEDDE